MKFTLGEFIDDIEKNGLPQGFTHTFRWYDKSRAWGPQDACALGQGYWNLFGRPEVIDHVEEQTFWATMQPLWPVRNDPIYPGHLQDFSTYIIDLNDTERLPIPEIAKRAREDWAEHLNVEFEYGN